MTDFKNDVSKSFRFSHARLNLVKEKLGEHNEQKLFRLLLERELEGYSQKGRQAGTFEDVGVTSVLRDGRHHNYSDLFLTSPSVHLYSAQLSFFLKLHNHREAIVSRLSIGPTKIVVRLNVVGRLLDETEMAVHHLASDFYKLAREHRQRKPGAPFFSLSVFAVERFDALPEFAIFTFDQAVLPIKGFMHTSHSTMFLSARASGPIYQWVQRDLDFLEGVQKPLIEIAANPFPEKMPEITLPSK